MRQLIKTIRAEVGEFSELTTFEKCLLSGAAAVRKNAQAPYSKYWVGVALHNGKGGTTVFGCNVERCNWTQTTHAAQNAIDNLVALLGPAKSKVEVVALVAAPANQEIILPPEKITEPLTAIEQIIVPCGHCLQIIWENCWKDPNVKLIGLAQNGEVTRTTMGDAFPIPFGPEHLGVDYSLL